MRLGNQISLDLVKDIISILNTTVNQKPSLLPDAYRFTTDKLSVKYLILGIPIDTLQPAVKFTPFQEIIERGSKK